MSAAGPVRRRAVLGACAGASVALAVGAKVTPVGAQVARPRIGVTLAPYYAWLANIAPELIEIVPLLPEGADPHAYQPDAGAVARLATLDALVINGLGHDAFVRPMLAAAPRQPVLIDTSAGLPRVASANGASANSHSFISVLSATQQINHLAVRLAELLPDRATELRANARAYNRRLRQHLADGLGALADVNHKDVTLAAVHDGYSYLLDELGLALTAVIQPRHGVAPSPAQLADTVQRLADAGVDVLFTEAAYADRVAQTVAAATGARLERLSHLYDEGYRADAFEAGIGGNIDAIVAAVRRAAGPG